MRKIILICDRCGKQYNKWDHKGKELYGVAEIIYDDFEAQLDLKKDLCEECYLSLEKWWKFPESVIDKNSTPLPKCNQCKYYMGVHDVQGHAPCSYHKSGGVLWNQYCSEFEEVKADADSD